MGLADWINVSNSLDAQKQTICEAAGM